MCVSVCRCAPLRFPSSRFSVFFYARRRGHLCCNAASRKKARQSSCILNSPPIERYASRFVLLIKHVDTQSNVSHAIYSFRLDVVFCCCWMFGVIVRQHPLCNQQQW